MRVPQGVHRAIRALVGWYPFRTPAYELNVFLGWLGFDDRKPLWLDVPPRGDMHGCALNVAHRYHRKHYYFLKAYFRQARKAPLAQFIEKTLEPGGTFLDIGSNIGLYAFYASRFVGDTGAVYAFDPDPVAVESLTRSSSINGNRVRVCPVALSDEPGELPFYRTTTCAHSLLPAVGEDPRYTDEKISVPVTTLDAWSKSQEGLDVSKIQAIKIDVEGVEARTVGGGLDMLERANRPPIWCEVRGPQGSTRAPNTFVDVTKRLAKLDYKAFLWNDGAPVPVDVADVVDRADILFRPV
jgi:FkbM family methyltransferase